MGLSGFDKNFFRQQRSAGFSFDPKKQKIKVGKKAVEGSTEELINALGSLTFSEAKSLRPDKKEAFINNLSRIGRNTQSGDLTEKIQEVEKILNKPLEHEAKILVQNMTKDNLEVSLSAVDSKLHLPIIREFVKKSPEAALYVAENLLTLPGIKKRDQLGIAIAILKMGKKPALKIIENSEKLSGINSNGQIHLLRNAIMSQDPEVGFAALKKLPALKVPAYAQENLIKSLLDPKSRKGGAGGAHVDRVDWNFSKSPLVKSEYKQELVGIVIKYIPAAASITLEYLDESGNDSKEKLNAVVEKGIKAATLEVKNEVVENQKPSFFSKLKIKKTSAKITQENRVKKVNKLFDQKLQNKTSVVDTLFSLSAIDDKLHFSIVSELVKNASPKDAAVIIRSLDKIKGITNQQKSTVFWAALEKGGEAVNEAAKHLFTTSWITGKNQLALFSVILGKNNKSAVSAMAKGLFEFSGIKSNQKIDLIFQCITVSDTDAALEILKLISQLKGVTSKKMLEHLQKAINAEEKQKKFGGFNLANAIVEQFPNYAFLVAKNIEKLSLSKEDQFALANNIIALGKKGEKAVRDNFDNFSFKEGNNSIIKRRVGLLKKGK